MPSSFELRKRLVDMRESHAYNNEWDPATREYAEKRAKESILEAEERERAPRTSSEVAHTFNSLKSSPFWGLYPEEQRHAATERAKTKHRELAQQEQTKPIVLPGEQPNLEDTTPMSVGANVVRSVVRIPGAAGSILSYLPAVAADAVGADETAKSLYGLSDDIDRWNQTLFPNTLKPLAPQDFSRVFGENDSTMDRIAGAGRIAGNMLANAPEVIGSTVAIAGPAAVAGRLAKLTSAFKTAKAAGDAAKAAQIVQRAATAGLGLGSLGTSLGGMQAEELRKTGELGDLLPKLPYAGLVAGLDTVVPWTAEKALTKGLLGDLGRGLVVEGVEQAPRTIGRALVQSGKEMFGEFPQESLQSIAESAEKKKDQGFLESIVSTFKDPKALTQAAEEGGSAALSSLLRGMGGYARNSRGRAVMDAVDLLDKIKDEGDDSVTASMEFGKLPAQVQRDAIVEKRRRTWENEFKRGQEIKREVGEVLPSVESLQQARERGIAAALAKAPAAQAPLADKLQAMGKKANAGKSVLPTESGPGLETLATPAAAAQDDSPEGLRGRVAIARTPDNQETQVQYRVVDARNLITSFDPQASKFLQDRNTDKKTSQELRNSIRDRVRPDELVTDHPGADVGAPIVGRDDEDAESRPEVEIGHHRAWAIRDGYAKGTMATYRDALVAGADRFGLNPEVVASMEQPVLVRERITPLPRSSREKWANRGNVARAADKSDAEKAVTDAKFMGPILPYLESAPDGNINLAKNIPFFQKFLGSVVSSSEHNALVSPDGTKLTDKGLRRVRNAIFASAYGSANLTESLADDTDTGIANILRGLQGAAPDTARVQADITKGDLHNLQIGSDIAKAAEKLADLKRQRMPVTDYLAQGLLEDDGMTQSSRLLLGAFSRASGSNEVAEIVRGFNRQVRAVGSPKQGNLFGETEVPAKENLVLSAIKSAGVEIDDIAPSALRGPSVLAPQPAAAVPTPAPTPARQPGPLERNLQAMAPKASAQTPAPSPAPARPEMPPAQPPAPPVKVARVMTDLPDASPEERRKAAALSRFGSIVGALNPSSEFGTIPENRGRQFLDEKKKSRPPTLQEMIQGGYVTDQKWKDMPLEEQKAYARAAGISDPVIAKHVKNGKLDYGLVAKAQEIHGTTKSYLMNADGHSAARDAVYPVEFSGLHPDVQPIADDNGAPVMHRGRAAEVLIDGKPHMVLADDTPQGKRFYAAPIEPNSGVESPVPFATAGSKRGFADTVNRIINRLLGREDIAGAEVVEPYFGGGGFGVNLDVFQKAARVHLNSWELAATDEGVKIDGGEKFRFMVEVQRGNKTFIDAALAYLKDRTAIEKTPISDEQKQTIIGAYRRSIDDWKNNELAQKGFPKLVALLQKKDANGEFVVRLYNERDTDFFKRMAGYASGRRLILVDDSNYAQMKFDSARDQYEKGDVPQPDGEKLYVGGEEDITPEEDQSAPKQGSLFGDGPAGRKVRVHADKRSLYRAVFDNGGVIVATNNFEHKLVRNISRDFGSHAMMFTTARIGQNAYDKQANATVGKSSPEYLLVASPRLKGNLLEGGPAERLRPVGVDSVQRGPFQDAGIRGSDAGRTGVPGEPESRNPDADAGRGESRHDTRGVGQGVAQRPDGEGNPVVHPAEDVSDPLGRRGDSVTPKGPRAQAIDARHKDQGFITLKRPSEIRKFAEEHPDYIQVEMDDPDGGKRTRFIPPTDADPDLEIPFSRKGAETPKRFAVESENGKHHIRDTQTGERLDYSTDHEEAARVRADEMNAGPVSTDSIGMGNVTNADLRKNGAVRSSGIPDDMPSLGSDDLIPRLREWLRKKYQGRSFVNAATRNSVEIHLTGIKETLNHLKRPSSRDPHFQSLPVLGGLIEKALPDSQELDRSGKSSVVKRFKVLFESPEKTYLATLVIKSYGKSLHYYDHKLTKFEELGDRAGGDALPPTSSSNGGEDSASHTPSMSSSTPEVKSGDDEPSFSRSGSSEDGSIFSGPAMGTQGALGVKSNESKPIAFPTRPKFSDFELDELGEPANPENMTRADKIRVAKAHSAAMKQYHEKLKVWSDSTPDVLQFGNENKTVYVVSKNTRSGESPWRMTWFQKLNGQMTPTGHLAFDTKLEAVKEAVLNEGEYRPDIMFSYAGKKAKGFADAEARGEVFPGKYDDLPRFEIDDSQMKIDLPKLSEGWFQEARKAHEKIRNLNQQEWDFNLDTDGPERYQAAEIRDAFYEAMGYDPNNMDMAVAERFHQAFEENDPDYLPPRMGRVTGLLGDIVTHPDLFKNYPKLANVMTTISVGPGNDDTGKHIVSTPGDEKHYGREEEIRISATSIAAARSILAHEIQHAIQIREGFAGGDSVKRLNEIKDNANYMIRVITARQTTVENDATEQAKKYLDDPTKAEFIREALSDEAYNTLVGKHLPPEKARVMAVRSKILKESAEYQDLAKEQKSYAKDAYSNPYDEYRRAAGEIEARDVESRLDGKSKNIPPYSSENIPRDQANIHTAGLIADSARESAPQLTRQGLEEIVSEITKKWGKGAPRVRIHNTVADMVKALGIDPSRATADTEGAYWEGTVHLVAENIGDRATALKVMAHESVGHHGLPKVLGKDYIKFLKQAKALAEKDRVVADAWAKVQRDYADKSESVRLAELGARLAEIYGRDPQSLGERARRWVEDLIGRVQEFLRGLGIDVEFNAYDVSRTMQNTRAILEKNTMDRLADALRGRKTAADPVFFSGAKATRETVSHADESRAMSLVEKPFESLNQADQDLVRRVAAKQVADIEAMYADILRAHDEDGKPLPAPNGKPSNLNRRQWVQVRTPLFKRWFGEWEKAQQFRDIDGMTPMDLSEEPSLADKKAIEDAFRAFGKATNQRDGLSVEFPVSMAGKIERHSGFDTKQIAGAFKRLFEESVPMMAEAEQAKEGHKDHSRSIDAYLHYVSKFKHGTGEYYIRFTVQKMSAKTGKKSRNLAHSSFISEVSIYEKGASPGSASLRVITPGLAEGKSPFDIKLSQWLGEVKNAAATSSKVVDANGEPLVVYHGTKAEPFSKFDLSKTSEVGFHFGSIGQAEQFVIPGWGRNSIAPRVYPVFLNLKSPYMIQDVFSPVPGRAARILEENGVISMSEREKVSSLDSDGWGLLKEMLEAKGYDSFTYVNTQETVGTGPDGKPLSPMEMVRENTAWVAFRPNQIKSATGNNGAFSESEDIRFSRSDMENDIVAEMDEKSATKLINLIKQFKREIPVRPADSEQAGIYDVMIGESGHTTIRTGDLDSLSDLITLERGHRRLGARHVLLDHYSGKRGRVTAGEILGMGKVIRDGELFNESDGRRRYVLKSGGHPTLTVVVGQKGDKNTVITFFSSRNRKTQGSADPGSGESARSHTAPWAHGGPTDFNQNMPSSGEEVKSDDEPVFSRKAGPMSADDVLDLARQHKAPPDVEFADRSAWVKGALAAKEALFDLVSEASAAAPEFAVAKRRNKDALSTEELLQKSRIDNAVEGRKAEDAILAAHIRADNSRVVSFISERFEPGPFRDWLMGKARRILAPWFAAQGEQRMFFMIAERVYWDGQKMAPIPGMRVRNPDGSFSYRTDGEDPITPDVAFRAFRRLSQEDQKLLTDRAKANEEYRQNFLSTWRPAQQARLLAAAMGSLLAHEPSTLDPDSAAGKNFSRIAGRLGAILPTLQGKIGKAEYARIERQSRMLLEMLDSGSVSQQRISEIEDSDKSVGALLRWERNLQTNQGIYGYVHHTGFDPAQSLNSGPGFDASGRARHPWFEDIPASQKGRIGGDGFFENLITADIAKARGEARANARNAWMGTVEDDYGLDFQAYQPQTDPGTGMTRLEELPPGYDRKSWVVANFGRRTGQKLYLPTNAYQLYKQAVEKGVIDPKIDEISGALGVVDRTVGMINEALLYHPSKFMRDLFSAPFHIAEFMRDWSFRNPSEALELPGLVLDGLKASMTPAEWQRLAPETQGQYSESLAYQDDERSHWITKMVDKIGGPGRPIGSVLGALLRQINLSGGGDLPIKRVFQVIGEKLAAKRNLTGVERDRFIYRVVNEYAFDTGDLPWLLSFIRGQRPGAESKIIGTMTRGIVPFMGYAYRLARQVFLKPFVEGLPALARKDWGTAAAEITRPVMWGLAAMLLRGGILGNPPEEEEAAGALRNRPNADPRTRTATRLLVGRDDTMAGGERYMSIKGLGQLSMADTVVQLLRGRQSPGDVSNELITTHPLAQVVISSLGMDTPYQKDVPAVAKAGRLVGQLAIPQLSRFGPDIAKSIRMISGDETIPDERKDGFFSALTRQLGWPSGTPRTDADGKVLLAPAQLEWLKFTGVNLKEIPYVLVEEEAEREAGGIQRLADALQKMSSGRGRARRNDDGSPMTETEYLKSIGMAGRGGTVLDASRKLKGEIDERAGGLEQIVRRLGAVGSKKAKTIEVSLTRTKARMGALERALEEMKRKAAEPATK